MSRAPTDPAHAPGAKPKISDQPAAAAMASPRTEAEYLKHQADTANQAMNRSLDEFKAHLAHALDLKTITHGHPWITIAAGAVAGFAAGAAITPSKTQSALNRLAEIEAALNRATIPPPHPSDVNGHPARPKSTISQTLMHELFALAKPVLSNVVAATIAGHTAAQQAADKVDDRTANGSASTGPTSAGPNTI
jgi:hypothetical protein